MCFKYEKDYGICFDALFIGEDDESLIRLLEEEYNIEIVDQPAFVRGLFELLERFHTEGAMRPQEETPEIVN